MKRLKKRMRKANWPSLNLNIAQRVSEIQPRVPCLSSLHLNSMKISLTRLRKMNRKRKTWSTISLMKRSKERLWQNRSITNCKSRGIWLKSSRSQEWKELKMRMTYPRIIQMITRFWSHQEEINQTIIYYPTQWLQNKVSLNSSKQRLRTSWKQTRSSHNLCRQLLIRMQESPSGWFDNLLGFQPWPLETHRGAFQFSSRIFLQTRS